MTRYWLTGYGRLPWPQLHPKLAGCTCLWADLDGLHEQPAHALPDTNPPLTTHLWAWNHQQLWRIRIDGTDTIAARLNLTSPQPNQTPHPEPVEVTQHQTPIWPHHDHRTAVHPRWRDQTVTLYDV